MFFEYDTNLCIIYDAKLIKVIWEKSADNKKAGKIGNGHLQIVQTHI